MHAIGHAALICGLAGTIVLLFARGHHPRPARTETGRKRHHTGNTGTCGPLTFHLKSRVRHGRCRESFGEQRF